MNVLQTLPRLPLPMAFGILAIGTIAVLVGLFTPRVVRFETSGQQIMLIVVAVTGISILIASRFNAFMLTFALVALLPVTRIPIPSGILRLHAMDVIIAIGLLLVLLRRMAAREPLLGGMQRSTAVLFILLTVMVACSGAIALAPTDAFLEAGRLLRLALIYPLIMATVASHRHFLVLICALAFAVVVAAIGTLLQLVGINIAGLSPDQYNSNVWDNGYRETIGVFESTFSRQPGLFYDPLTNGQFLATSAAFFLPYLWVGGWKLRRSALALCALTSLAIISTVSRTPIISWVVALGASYLLVVSPLAAGITRWMRMVLMALMAMGIAVMVWYVPDGIPLEPNTRLSSDVTAGTWEARLAWMVNSLPIIVDHPFLGIGLENYKIIIPSYDPSQLWQISRFTYIPAGSPENGYLKLLYELGLLGSIPLILLVTQQVASLLRNVIGGVSYEKSVAVAGTLLAFLVTGINLLPVYNFTDSRLVALVTIILALGHLQLRYNTIDSRTASGGGPRMGMLKITRMPDSDSVTTV